MIAMQTMSPLLRLSMIHVSRERPLSISLPWCFLFDLGKGIPSRSGAYRNKFLHTLDRNYKRNNSAWLILNDFWRTAHHDYSDAQSRNISLCAKKFKRIMESPFYTPKSSIILLSHS